MKKVVIFVAFVGMLLFMAVPSNQTGGALVWTDRGCGAVYTVYDSVIVYFTPYAGYDFELWSFHTGKSPQLLSAGVGTGYTFYVSGTVGPPAGQITFVLSMSCTEGCYYCGMCDYDECTIFVQEYVCNCPNQCYGDDLWAMTCVNGVCVQDYIIEENSQQCGYDPCKNVACTTVCRGFDLWTQECVNGACVDDRLLEANSTTCGYDPCTNIVCRDVCKGFDLWSQKCVNGACVDDRLLEANSVTCGFDPCQDHCTNQQQDCGEYGVDCGGGCPFVDSDSDGVEDCMDLCPNSRCNRVDTNGCEVDVDADGVMDCEDDCPTEKGDASNRGCPSSMNLILILGGIGAVIAVGGGLALFGMRGGRPPSELRLRQVQGPSQSSRPISRPTPEDIALRKEAAERIARETAKEAAQKKAGAKAAEAASKKVSAEMAEAASKKVSAEMAEAASKKVSAEMAEAASKKVSAEMAEAASKKVSAEMAEAASKKIGGEVAGAAAKDAGAKTAQAAAGAGVAGVVAKKQKETYCPNCGEKLPPDSKFCSICGHKL